MSSKSWWKKLRTWGPILSTKHRTLYIKISVSCRCQGDIRIFYKWFGLPHLRKIFIHNLQQWWYLEIILNAKQPFLQQEGGDTRPATIERLISVWDIFSKFNQNCENDWTSGFWLPTIMAPVYAAEKEDKHWKGNTA